ncbi:MAG TPA: hypothetical protein VMZ53_29925 [Kofleriaceae bacterium]|nr:hypothetical protein [Kofleriaceae bacterium]
MKLGTFIVAALCAAASTNAFAGTHDRAIEHYREQYEQRSDPHLLTLIADEYRAAGQMREALDYYCSYMYVDAAGEDADRASLGARELAVRLGHSGATDHEACNPKKGEVAKPVTGVEALDLRIPPPAARITKREVVGLSMLAAGIGGLGMALYEGREVARVRGAQIVNDPTVNVEDLAAQADAHQRNQKLWLLAGGATMITGGILYVVGRHDRKQQDARALVIAPTANKNGGGLVMGRRF